MAKSSSIGLRPLEDRVIVSLIEADEQIEGGIVLPESAKEKPQDAEVLAVGPGRLNEDGTRTPIDVQVGDVVIFSKYGGTEVKLGSDEVMILRADDILAVRTQD